MFVIFVYAHDATIGRWLIFAICLLEDGLLILMNLFIHKIRIQKYEKANGKTKKMCKNFFILQYFTNFAIKKTNNINIRLWK